MIDIFTLPLFEKRLKHYRKKNPKPTTAISLKDKVYKIRMSNSSSNKGKSAGYRVYYFYKENKDTLLLFYMHSKSDEPNINDVRLDKLIIECKIFFDNL